MRRGLQFALAGLFATLSVTLHGQTAPAVTTMASPPLRFEEKPARTLPRVFEENRGQADDHVRYVSRGQGYSLLLAADAATLALAATPSDPYRSIRMTFAGAGPVGRIDGVDELAGKVFYAGAKAGLDTGAIKTFRRVRYSSPYPGIDADYHVSDRQIEFDFVVAAKANPHDIALAFSGVDRVQVDAAGELVLEAGPRKIRLKQPLAYQERDGVRTFVDASYLVSPREANTIRFALGSYDSAQPLVIDPVFVIGSLDDDFLAGLEVNAAGEAFLLGNTSACALTKLDAAGVNAVYSILFLDTFQCGTLALSPGGTAYFTGYEVPVTPGLRVATVVRVDDSSGSPVITRIAANNYDQIYSAVSALAADIKDRKSVV